MLKAYKVGLVARFSSIYRVNYIYVYRDSGTSAKWLKKVKKLFLYMLVAPYLRKKVFPPNDPDLRYAGVLLPLQLETHGIGGLKKNEVRQALIIDARAGEVVLDIGVESYVRTSRDVVSGSSASQLIVNGKRIVHVKIEDTNPLRLGRSPLTGVYIGYRVKTYNSLRELLEKTDQCIVIGTSRYGEPVSKIYRYVSSLFRKAKCVVTLYGGPRRGINEIASLEGIDLDRYVEIVVKTIEDQGVLVVRTEEALLATLSILDFIRRAEQEH